jgi:hypothetical protein
VLGGKESDAGLRAEDTAWWDWQTSLEETRQGRSLSSCTGYLCGAYGTERLYVQPTIIRHGLDVSLHEKALLGRACQDMLWIDHAWAHGLQANGDVIVPSHDDLALTIQGNGAWPTGDFDSLTHGKRCVTLYPDWHDQARGNGRQDSCCGGMRLDHQPTIGWHPVYG